MSLAGQPALMVHVAGAKLQGDVVQANAANAWLPRVPEGLSKWAGKRAGDRDGGHATPDSCLRCGHNVARFGPPRPRAEVATRLQRLCRRHCGQVASPFRHQAFDAFPRTAYIGNSTNVTTVDVVGRQDLSCW